MKRLIALWLAALMLAAQPIQAVVCVGFGQGAAPSGYSDDFTGSDGTALATHDSNWGDLSTNKAVANLRINTNQVSLSSSYATTGARYTASTSDTSKITFKALSGTSGVMKGVSVRANGTSRGYNTYLSTISGGNYTKIYIAKDTTYVDDCTVSVSLGADHVIKLVASGTGPVTVTAYIDGSSACSITDSTSPITSGNPGFYMTGDGTVGDNFMDSWSDYDE